MEYIFFFLGFFIHVARDYQRYKDNLFFMEYYKIVKYDLITSLVISCCLVIIADIDNSLNNITALTLGYAGDSFFRFIIKTKIGE